MPIILENSQKGLEARQNFSKAISKAGVLFLIPSFLYSEGKLSIKVRTGLNKFSLFFGIKRLPLLWIFEDWNSIESKKARTYYGDLLLKYSSMILKAPPKFYGFRILNFFGLQIIRDLLTLTGLNVRKLFFRRSDHNLAEKAFFKKEGFIKVENFLPEGMLQEVRQYIETHSSDFIVYDQKITGFPATWRKLELSEANASIKQIQDFILKHPLIRELVEETSYRKMNYRPEVSYFDWTCEQKDIGTEHQFDYENILHFDVCFPTTKIFLYLEETTEDNAPFVFCPGSQKFNLRRILYNWYLSWRVVGTKEWNSNAHLPVSDSEKKFLNIKEVSMTGKANTLVLANVMGLHRRKLMTKPGTRKLLFVNFRQIDSLSNMLKLK